MYVFSNTAVALDGRIGTVGQEHLNVGTDEDRRRMGILRAKADAVVIGGRTFRMDPDPIVEPEALQNGVARRPIINAVLTRSGIAQSMDSPWAEPRVALHIFGPPDLDGPSHKAVGAHVHVAESPVEVLDQLEQMGCRNVLVEGGGDIIFQLIAAKRIETVFMTLAPRIIGGVGAPTLADGRGFRPHEIVDFRLADCERVGDELFLRYDIKR